MVPADAGVLHTYGWVAVTRLYFSNVAKFCNHFQHTCSGVFMSVILFIWVCLVFSSCQETCFKCLLYICMVSVKYLAFIYNTHILCMLGFALADKRFIVCR